MRLYFCLFSSRLKIRLSVWFIQGLVRWVLQIDWFCRGPPIRPHVIDRSGGDGLEVRLPVAFLLLLLRGRHLCHQAGVGRVGRQRGRWLLQREVDRGQGWVRAVAWTFAGAVLAVCKDCKFSGFNSKLTGHTLWWLLLSLAQMLKTSFKATTMQVNKPALDQATSKSNHSHF